jgi:hydroxymethylglutaryl-CoA reductase
MSDAPAVGGAVGTAPGKVILLGEHAVVYGRTALAAAVDRHVVVTVTPRPGQAQLVADPAIVRAGPTDPSEKLAAALERAAAVLGLPLEGFEVSVHSDLPVAVGLGSSAAFSVALIRALGHFFGHRLDAPTVCGHAFELEKLFHGFPSGIDNTVATYGGAIAFKRNASVRPLVLGRPMPLVIAIGRTPRETQKTVTALRQRWEADPARYESWFDEIDDLVTEAEGLVAAGALDGLGILMNRNQNLLERLGVSTEELDRMVALARAHGACGAKLTGGGGGGAVICLCPEDRERLVGAFAREGWFAFAADIRRRDRGDDAVSDDVAEHARPVA